VKTYINISGKGVRLSAKQNKVIHYLIAISIGLLIGFNVIPVNLVAVIYLGLAALCLFHASRNNIAGFLSTVPYMIYPELIIRGKVLFVPYLFIQYLLIAIFSIMILTGSTKVKIHSRAFILLILFCIIEVGNSFRAVDPVYARTLITNTVLLTVISTWGSFNILNTATINRFLSNVKTASIFLCGYALVRQITGNNSYELTSMSEAVNGLPAVQLSGYLGFSSILFFLSVMNDDERKNVLINLVLLGLSSLVMLISFSRGGAYFLAIIMALYFLFNSRQLKSYFLFILLLPVALVVYFYVTDVTEGLIVKRYTEKGSSGRDFLVKAGYEIFSDEPVAGVGTGNFNIEIVKRGLYSSSSGAHDEFIRVAAEHGVIGIITYFGFYIVLLFEILNRKGIRREYALYFYVLFCLIIVHNALKISIQPMILLLIVATPNVILVKKKIPVKSGKDFIVGY
jgi:O-antigen ligase